MGNSENLTRHRNFQSNGFDKRPEDTKKGGRPKGIKARLKELLEGEGEYLIKAKNIVETKANGDVVVKLPTETTLAYHLIQLAKKNSNLGLRALQTLIDHLEGKPRQTLGFSNDPPEPFDILPPPQRPPAQNDAGK